MSKGASIRERYESLVWELGKARENTLALRSQYEEARKEEGRISYELSELQSALDSAFDAVAHDLPSSFSTPKLKPIMAPSFVRELLAAFSMTGPTTLDELRSSLDLQDSAIHNRLQKAKKLKLIEGIGHGEYILTELGREACQPGLRIVTTEK